MAEHSIPRFVDDEGYYGGMTGTAAPPPATLDEKRAQERRRMFAPRFDLYLLAVVGMLCAIGMLMVYSSSINASFLATENASSTYFFQRQIRNFLVGLAALYILARIDYRIWKRLSIWMMVVMIMLLLAVLQFGDTRLEAQRAFIIFGISVQPGEMAKMVIVIYMAAWLASKRHKLQNVTYGIIPFSIMVGAVAFLIVLQPDLSTAASILATALTMFFLAGASMSQISVIVAAAGFSGFLIATEFPYAKTRIEDHLNAVDDLSRASIHVQAAVTAFLNGGLFGVGLGEGRQKFGPLPFPHTDSVFAVIGEELGLFGCAVVIFLYVMLVYRGFTVARNARDAFGALLAAGVTCWLTYDALLNIAVMTAIIPPTGVPLPFISFGGSSLVSAMAGIGLILSVSRVAAEPVPPEKRRLEELEIEAPPEKVKVKKEKPRPEKKRKPLIDRRAFQQARRERRQKRQQAVQQIKKQRMEDRTQARIQERKLTGGIPDIDELLPEEEAEFETAAEAETPETMQEELSADTTEGTDIDSDSDNSRGNRRGRISRISCS